MTKDEVTGPPALPLLGHAPWFLRDKPGFLLDCYRRYGQVVRLQLGGPTFLVVAPEDVRHVLATHADNYRKSERVVGAAAQQAMGVNVLTAEGEAHRRLRRALQPWFRQGTLDAVGPRASARIAARARRWLEAGAVDVVAEARQIAGECVVAALLGESALERHPQLLGLIEARRRHVEELFGFWPGRRWRAARRHAGVHGALMQILDDALARRGAGEGVIDEQDDASALASDERRQQLLAVLVAGYETTAAMMAWALHAVARDGAMQRRCADRAYASLVIAETLRLRPPTWMFVRVAQRADRLPGGGAIPAGAKVYLSQYVSHRQPAIFAEPERFEPERFAGDRAFPPFAYFPFGGGPRMCFGESLARLLGVTLLETLAPAVDLRPIANRGVRAVPGLTLQMKGPVPVAVQLRA